MIATAEGRFMWDRRAKKRPVIMVLKSDYCEGLSLNVTPCDIASFVPAEETRETPLTKGAPYHSARLVDPFPKRLVPVPFPVSHHVLQTGLRRPYR